MAGVKEVIVSNTGYTGAGGFELYFYPEHADAIWNAVFEAGQSWESSPWDWVPAIHFCLEMGFCLYGNDIDDTTSPIEAGLGLDYQVCRGKNFINRAMLEKKKQEGGLAVS